MHQASVAELDRGEDEHRTSTERSPRWVFSREQTEAMEGPAGGEGQATS